MSTAILYGHDLDLFDPDEGGLVTDVIVLARVVRYNDDGRAMDAMILSSTRNTGGIIQGGMLSTALDLSQNWMLEEDDE